MQSRTAIGYQRERQGKEAGLRTHMLVALGSTFFVLVPLQAGMAIGDLSRVLHKLGVADRTQAASLDAKWSTEVTQR